MVLSPSSLVGLERCCSGTVDAPTCGRPSQVCSLIFFVQDLSLLVSIRLLVQRRRNRPFYPLLCSWATAPCWASSFLREALCFSVQDPQRVWPEIAGALHLTQSPRDMCSERLLDCLAR